jgi:hypothetical protein
VTLPAIPQPPTGLSTSAACAQPVETVEETADAILDSLGYLVVEARAAGLDDLAVALTGVMLSPRHWPGAEPAPHP